MEQTFTAPTGFRFTGGVSYGYYMVSPHRTGNLTSTITDDGRTVTVKDGLHLNTDPATDREPVIYTFTLMALPNAEPGTHSDGKAPAGVARGVLAVGKKFGRLRLRLEALALASARGSDV
ncbi:hypothetical protein ABZ547_33550 [Streptomyces sparsogenes]|uniref:hypothetical protein n=1 Tax=Streptomyces sparsogenes TaxID=67365 RepID=UPI0033C65224